MDLSESQVPDKTKNPKTCQISVMSNFDLKSLLYLFYVNPSHSRKMDPKKRRGLGLFATRDFDEVWDGEGYFDGTGGNFWGHEHMHL